MDQMHRLSLRAIATVLLCLLLVSACDTAPTAPITGEEPGDEEPGGDVPVLVVSDTLVTSSEAISAFGSMVALDDDRMIVGDWSSSQDTQYEGALHVYTSAGGFWVNEATIRPIGSEANLWFGRAAAIDGERIVVGSGSSGIPFWDRRPGPVYLYERVGTEWGATDTLTSADVTPECYGITDQVGISGTYMFTDTIEPQGITPVLCAFAREGEAGLVHHRIDLDELLDLDFGVAGWGGGFYRVGVHPDGVVVQGARGGLLVSYTFSYDGGTWSRAFQTLRELRTDESKGYLAVTEDRLAIGLPPPVDATTSTEGIVEVYIRSGGQWILDDVLTQPVGPEQDYFGYSPAIAGDLLVVGNRRVPHRLEGPHSVQVFWRSASGWEQVETLRASDPGYDSSFSSGGGAPVDLTTTIGVSGSTVAVGAVPHVEGVPNGVFVFEMDGL